MKKLSAGMLRLLIMLSVLFPVVLKAQMELVPVDHKVYPFLEMMSMKGLINYNSASIPISRRAVASYLVELEKVKEKLSKTERGILADLMVEFSYDINKNMDKSYTLVQDFKPSDPLSIFNDEKQKYLVSYTDPNFSLFLDGIGAVSYRNFNAQSFPKAHLSLFEIGPRLRGTLYDNIGYYVQVTEGQAFGGDQYARQVAAGYDPLLTASYQVCRQQICHRLSMQGTCATQPTITPSRLPSGETILRWEMGISTSSSSRTIFLRSISADWISNINSFIIRSFTATFREIHWECRWLRRT